MLHKKQNTLTIILAISVFIISACASASSEPSTPSEPSTNLANPASVYCEEEGGKVEIRTDADGGQYGVCVFADGSECDEWDFFGNKCKMGDQKTAPSPVHVPGYINDNHGFSLNPPTEWAIEGYDQYLQLVRSYNDQKYILFVGFRNSGEEERPFRAGMGAGDIVAGEPFNFMGEQQPRNLLVYNGKTKMVIYGAELEVDDLRVSIYLDPDYVNGNYDSLEIPPEIIQEADQIVSSFARYP